MVVIEPSAKPDFAFHFVATREEALEAFEANLRKNSRLRPWLRVCLIALGWFWLVGGLLTSTGLLQGQSMWQSVLLGFGGWAIVWRHCLNPMIERRKIRANNPVSQKLALEFDPSGIRILHVGTDSYVRSWSELLEAVFGAEGVSMAFTDGQVHVVPKRAFYSADHRRAFFVFLKRMAPGAGFYEE